MWNLSGLDSQMLLSYAKGRNRVIFLNSLTLFFKLRQFCYKLSFKSFSVLIIRKLLSLRKLVKNKKRADCYLMLTLKPRLSKQYLPYPWAPSILNDWLGRFGLIALKLCMLKQYLCFPWAPSILETWNLAVNFLRNTFANYSLSKSVHFTLSFHTHCSSKWNVFVILMRVIFKLEAKRY